MSDELPVRVADDDRPGWAQLVFTGPVTVASARAFHTTARELAARGTNVAVRCEGAESLDTSAIQILLCLGRELGTRGHKLDISGVSDALADSFRLAGLAKPQRA